MFDKISAPLWLLVLFFVSLLDIHPALGAPVTAQMAFDAKKYSEVVGLLSPRFDKLNRDELKLLGQAHSLMNNSPMATRAFTAMLALNPKDYEAKTLLGREQFLMRKDKEAILTLKEAIEMNQKYEPAYLQIAEIYEKRKNRYELRMLYGDLIDRLGKKPQYLTKMCELSTTDGLYDLSKDYCPSAIKLSPYEPKNYIYMGLTYKEIGQPNEAQQTLKKAADDFPKSEEAQLAYAQLVEDQKNYLVAYNYYKRAVATNPLSFKGQVGLGISSSELQKYEECLEALKKACKINRSAIASLRRVANTLRTNKLTEWLRKYEDAIDRCSN